MTDTDWAGRGFTGPPAAPDPAPQHDEMLRKILREMLHYAPPAGLTLQQVERHFAVRERGQAKLVRDGLIAELAAMRDDGEVRFEGPRYVLNMSEKQDWARCPRR